MGKSKRVIIYVHTQLGRKRGESQASSLAEANKNLDNAQLEVKQAERAQRFGFDKNGWRVGSVQPLDVAVSYLAEDATDDNIVAALVHAYGEKEDDVRDAIYDYILWDGRSPSESRYIEACLTAQTAEAVRDLFLHGYTNIGRTYPDAIIESGDSKTRK